jgi:large subunit ribosomal protein L25
MSVLKAEKRSGGMKARKLRSAGYVPGCIYGKNLDGSIHIQVRQSELRQALAGKSRGSKLTLSLGSKKLNVLIKDISRDPVTNEIENLQLQNLVSDEVVTSTAKVVLVNKEKITSFIQQRVFEIPYKALPSNMVEEVEIDLEGMNVGSTVKVSDLDIARNKKIELLIDPETLVLSIEQNKRTAEPQTETAEAEA